MVIGWKTKKLENGSYGFSVHEVGYQYYREIKTGSGFKSRARAKSMAQKWCRYLKQQVAS